MATRQRGNDIGPIGAQVGDRVRRVRLDQSLTQAQLSERMRRLGRPIPTASIGRLESGDRKVDVDDLMALAYALDVSPLSLLLPFTESPSAKVRPAGAVGLEMDALAAWQWAVGDSPHHYDSGNPEYQEASWRNFRARSHPWWLAVEAPLDERLVALAQRMPPYPGVEPVDALYDDLPEADHGQH